MGAAKYGPAMRARTTTAGVLTIALLCTGLAAPAAIASVRGDVAALQVALRRAGAYAGTVDGVLGPRHRGGRPPGPASRRPGRGRRRRPGHAARARLARPPRLRQLARSPRGAVGWDVAALQFKLAAHGFPSGPVDGALGPRSVAALQRFQAWAGLRADGVAGPSTRRALAAPVPRSPVRLRRPVQAAAGDRFGPRWNVFHAGVDFPAPSGTPVTAAGFGTVVTAGYDSSGWGNMVVIGHRFGLRTLYAHLASFAVSRGQAVGVGQRIGTVGATGRASGPHLHFELLLRGANVDPLSALG